MEPTGTPPQATYVPAQVIQTTPRRSALWSVLILLLLGLLGVSLLVNLVLLAGGAGYDSTTRLQERHVSHSQLARDKIAVITVEGTILEGRGFVKRQIDRVAKDDDVKAVVLRVNSPGGTVTGSDYIFHHLKKMLAERQIPMVVSMGSLAASGGYYISMAVGDRPESIFAEPTTWTGSIGVMIPHYNVAKLMEEWGVEQDSVVSHRLKGMGSITRKMTPEERTIFQALVDASFTRFKNIVKEGRARFRRDPAALDKVATGQVFTAEQAVENGLVDKVGFLEDAVDQAIKLAGLSSDEVRVIDYKPEFSLLDLMLGEAKANKAGFGLDTLAELATPKAYFLCTWLAPLMSSSDR